MWDLQQRAHAFWHRLWRTSDAIETRELYELLRGLYLDVGIAPETARDEMIAGVSTTLHRMYEIPLHHPLSDCVCDFVADVFATEDHFALPEINWLERRSVTQWWQIRDQLNAERPLIEDFETVRDNIIDSFALPVLALLDGAPGILETNPPAGGITVPTTVLHAHADLAQLVDACMEPGIAEPLMARDVFPRLRQRVMANIVAASGGNPADIDGFNKVTKWPQDFVHLDRQALVDLYLKGTPFRKLFSLPVQYHIPQARRFEHHHIIAGSGHGKTQTLQYLIANDLEAVADGQQSVVVLDSQGDLIRNISRLQEFAPGEPLHDRVVIIDPTDVEYPVSLNLFDVGMERLNEYPLLERERLTNSILELYDFVLGTLLSAEMTQKQNVIFRYVTRLMLHIPDATIHTLRELMEPGSEVKFAADIAKLEGTAKHFFETEFTSREFEQTKKQVLRRLWGILENQTFERMFSHPRSKLDLFAEMNAGKVILINTAKDLLKETGSQIFGRFFIALIAQAAQERATLKPSDRMPTMVYIDEAADYFDRNIGLILAQARKYNVGMVLAHQYLGQLEPKLQDAFAANTAIKFAGGVSQKDARALGPMLHAAPELIERQPKGSFVASVRGQDGAVPLQFPLGFLEDKPRMDQDARHELQAAMRERYAVHYERLGEDEDEIEADSNADEDQADPTDAEIEEAPTDVEPDAPPDTSPTDDPSTKASDTW